MEGLSTHDIMQYAMLGGVVIGKVFLARMMYDLVQRVSRLEERIKGDGNAG